MHHPCTLDGAEASMSSIGEFHKAAHNSTCNTTVTACSIHVKLNDKPTIADSMAAACILVLAFLRHSCADDGNWVDQLERISLPAGSSSSSSSSRINKGDTTSNRGPASIRALSFAYGGATACASSPSAALPPRLVRRIPDLVAQAQMFAERMQDDQAFRDLAYSSTAR